MNLYDIAGDIAGGSVGLSIAGGTDGVAAAWAIPAAVATDHFVDSLGGYFCDPS